MGEERVTSEGVDLPRAMDENRTDTISGWLRYEIENMRDTAGWMESWVSRMEKDYQAALERIETLETLLAAAAPNPAFEPEIDNTNKQEGEK